MHLDLEFPVKEKSFCPDLDFKSARLKRSCSEDYINCLNKLYNITGEKYYLEEIRRIRYREYFASIEKFREMG